MGHTTFTVVAVFLLTGAVGAASRSAVPADREVTLSITHSRFSLDELHVERGQRVRFVVSNTDPIDHELIVGDMASQIRHERGTEPSHGERDGEVTIPLFDRRETSYTFRRPGTYWFGCHLPGHWDYGMVGKVIVR
ncbi:MAG: plastocyanin/azurin family copper-binding protein [Actinomycetota bacterium]